MSFAPFRYMSWNIQNLSERHSAKQVWVNLSVKIWIANIILDMKADIVGTMEVTLGSGESACKLITKSLQQLSDLKRSAKRRKPPAQKWICEVSLKSTNSSKADKYCIFFNQEAIELADNPSICPIPGNTKYTNRLPIHWVIGDESDSSTLVDCLLWHAPAPKDMKKKEKETIQHIANVYKNIINNAVVKRGKALISGDFNHKTSDTEAYKPLTNPPLNFKGLFDGELTTLKTLRTATLDYIRNNKTQFLDPSLYNSSNVLAVSGYDNIFIRQITAIFQTKICIPYVILEQQNGKIIPSSISNKAIQNALKQARIISDHLPLLVTISSTKQNLTQWIIL